MTNFLGISDVACIHDKTVRVQSIFLAAGSGSGGRRLTRRGYGDSIPGAVLRLQHRLDSLERVPTYPFGLGHAVGDRDPADRVASERRLA